MPKASGSSGRTIFVCQECGKESLKWVGRCPNCQAWNSFIEQLATKTLSSFLNSASLTDAPEELSKISTAKSDRLPLPLPEINRVLGGGLVPGSLVLIGGDPGIGKSTLLLQIAALVSKPDFKVMYVSGEETRRQVKLRADRLGIKGDGLYLLSETNIDAIMGQIENVKPAVVIVDSIQSVYLPEQDSAPGSITQVRDCTLMLMQLAKSANVPIFISGHVTKEGTLAGPRVLEHIVDVVLYLEGETFSTYRLLRCVKNRFGGTNEVGVFEMKEEGLIQVEDPSHIFLSEREGPAVGSVVVPVLEGNRPLLVEVQGLTITTSFGLPRRTANGIDFNRLLLVSAVLSRRAGLKLGNQDIIVNVTGGLKIREPAADLGIAIAITSSFRDLPVDPEMTAVGEVGLSGEMRPVPQLERRLTDVCRMGFKRAIVPRAGSRNVRVPQGLALITVSNLRDAIKMAWVKGTAIQEEPGE